MLMHEKTCVVPILLIFGLNDFYLGSTPVTFINITESFIKITHSLKFYSNRVPTSSGNHGKSGKSPKKVPCIEK